MLLAAAVFLKNSLSRYVEPMWRLCTCCRVLQQVHASRGQGFSDAVKVFGFVSHPEMVGVAREMGEIRAKGVGKASANLQAAVVEVGDHQPWPLFLSKAPDMETTALPTDDGTWQRKSLGQKNGRN